LLLIVVGGVFIVSVVVDFNDSVIVLFVVVVTLFAVAVADFVSFLGIVVG